jgi:hypothetical protein
MKPCASTMNLVRFSSGVSLACRIFWMIGSSRAA